MEQQQQTKPSLFREKSLEAMNSPEALNDYLRVTSPGVWLVLAAVIAVLVGAIFWGIFGRINTTASLAVSVSDGNATAYVPYDALQKIMERGSVTLEGRDYALQASEDLQVTIVDEATNPYLRVRGGLNVGDVTVAVPVALTSDAALADGIYSGTVVTESLQPISLLLRQ